MLQPHTGHAWCCHPRTALQGMHGALLPSGLQAGPETWRFPKMPPVQSQGLTRTRQQWCGALAESSRALLTGRGMGQGCWGWRGALLALAIVSSWGAEPVPHLSPSPSPVTLREGGSSHPAHALPVALHQPQRRRKGAPAPGRRQPRVLSHRHRRLLGCVPAVAGLSRGGCAGWDSSGAGQLRGPRAGSAGSSLCPGSSGRVSPAGQELGQRPGAGGAVVSGYASAVQCPLVLPGCSAAGAAQGTVCEQTSVSQ